MANFMRATHFPVDESLRPEFNHTDFKTEPFEYPLHSQRQAYTYSSQHPYSEEELAESLGWVEYPQNSHPPMPSNHGMHLSSEMTSQRSAIPHRPPSLPLSSSIASNGTYNSLSIRQSAQSPSGWHSSFETPSQLAEPSSTSNRSLGTPLSVDSETFRKDGSIVAAEKKAMRRYSHNAVERRRRDNINEQIHELAVIVNELEHIYSPRAESIVTNTNNNTKPNKGIVLRRSVEYLKMLKTLVDDKSERERQMEQELVRLGGRIPSRASQEASVSMWIDESAIAEDDD